MNTKITNHIMNVFLKVSGLSTNRNRNDSVRTNMNNGKNNVGKVLTLKLMKNVNTRLIRPIANHAKAARSIILISSGCSFQLVNCSVFLGFVASILLIGIQLSNSCNMLVVQDYSFIFKSFVEILKK